MELIRFATFQAVSFTLAGSLFLYMFLVFIKWCITQMGKDARPARPARR